MTKVDFDTVNSAALRILPALCTRWLPGGKLVGREYVARNPKRRDNKLGSFSINVKTGRWSDFSSGEKGGDPVSLAAFLFDLSQGDAAERLAEMLNLREAR